MSRWLAIWTFFLVAFSVHAQERSLSFSADRNEILLGEQFHLQWTLKSHAADTIHIPALNDSVFKNFDFLEKGKVDTAYDSTDITQRIVSQTFLITSFDSGYYPIPPLEADINGSTVASDPFLISVKTVAVDTSRAIKEIRQIAEMPFSLQDWLREYWEWPTGILVAVLAIALAVYLFARRKKKPEKPEPPKIEVPAHIWALEELQKLEEKKLWQQGNYKGFYSELTDILRGYIEHRFHIAALEQTSDEILHSIRHEPAISSEQQDKLRKLLTLADLVKFAKEKPLPAENGQGLETVKGFVETTKKPAVEKPSETEVGNG